MLVKDGIWAAVSPLIWVVERSPTCVDVSPAMPAVLIAPIWDADKLCTSAVLSDEMVAAESWLTCESEREEIDIATILV